MKLNNKYKNKNMKNKKKNITKHACCKSLRQSRKTGDSAAKTTLWQDTETQPFTMDQFLGA